MDVQNSPKRAFGVPDLCFGSGHLDWLRSRSLCAWGVRFKCSRGSQHCERVEAQRERLQFEHRVTDGADGNLLPQTASSAEARRASTTRAAHTLYTQSFTTSDTCTIDAATPAQTRWMQCAGSLGQTRSTRTIHCHSAPKMKFDTCIPPILILSATPLLSPPAAAATSRGIRWSSLGCAS